LDQYLLDFRRSNSFDEEDYIITSSNYHAVEWVKKWPNSGSGVYQNICWIVGEKGCGKTHLSKIWAQQSLALNLSTNYLLERLYLEDGLKAYIVDEISDFLDNEIALFHFIEEIVYSNKSLMILSSIPLDSIKVKLPDLQSRLNSFLVLEIVKPDENTTKHILIKYFSDRQVTVKAEVLNYLVSRLKFSYQEIAKMVEKLDQASLLEQKTISIPFIKKIIGL
jgi:chromosomal replication initiation ATPase DnaA